jgi:CoA:oxalate CoA-transferase
MTNTKPLAGLKILDFSAVYAGPICTRLLSDCGAEVIKIEPPIGGDVTRGFRGTSRVFAHFNAGKQSMAINLNKPSGQALAMKLAADADVVIENYRPGVMKRFGLGYDSLRKVRPDLVYCSISGFGQSGPYVDRAAYAPIAHAASGFDVAHTQAQGNPDARPPVWGIMVADMLTGSYAFGAIQTALFARERTGRGDYIDVTMIESMMMLIPGQIQSAQLENPPPAGGFHPIRVKDGFVMICIVSEKNLRCLCEAINRPDMLEDEKFQRNQRWRHYDDFLAQIETWSIPLTAIECESRLNEAGVPCSIYNAPSDLFAHPQLVQRGSFTEFEDATSAYFIQNAPFQFASADISTPPVAPLLGEHTDEILAEKLDLNTEQIAALREEATIR